MEAFDLEENRQKLYSRMPLVGGRQRQQAADALARAAQDGAGPAARVLAEALVSHFDEKVQQTAFAALRALNDPRTVNAVCAVWDETRNAELAALIKDGQWVASTPFELRVKTALVARRTSLFDENDPQMAIALIDACAEDDPNVAREAARALSVISDPAMRETVCELASLRECPQAAVDAIVSGGHAPNDPAARALFYLQTGQLHPLTALPDATPLLRRAYEDVDPKTRARALRRLRSAGRPDWVTWIYDEERVRSTAVSPLEWEAAFDVLRSANAYAQIWTLAHLCPPEMSAEAIRLLLDKGFRPDDPEERETLQALGRARPTDPAQGRLYLPEPQPQAALVTGLPILRDGRVMAHQAGYRTFAFAGDGRQVVTAGEELAVWETWTGRRRNTMQVDAQTPSASVRLLAVSGDGAMLATCEDTVVNARPVSRIWLWALGDEAPLVKLEEDRIVSDMDFSPDGHTLAIAGAETTRLWDVRDGRRRLARELSGAVSCVRWWPRTELLAAGSPGGNVQLWDPADAKVRRSMQGKAPALCQMRFSPDGRHIATLHEDASGRLWSVQDATCLSVLHHQSGLRVLDFSPDGTLLATGTGDGTLRLWQVEPFKLHLTLQRPGPSEPRGLKSIAFSPDGRRLASATQGQRHVTLWSLTRNGAVAECQPAWPSDVPLPPGDLKEPAEVQFCRTSEALAARFGTIVQVWIVTHPQALGAMSAGDLRMAQEVAARLEDDVDARAWKYAAAVLHARFGRPPASP